MYEGIALSIRDGYAVLPQAVDEIRLPGGGAKSAFWSQIIADCTGSRVVVPEGSEFGARGAALLAAVGAGWYPDVTPATAQSGVAQSGVAQSGAARVFVPQPDRKVVYDRLYAVYRTLQHDLRGAWRLVAGR